MRGHELAFYLSSMLLPLGTVYFILAVTLRRRLARDRLSAIMFGISILLTFALAFAAATAARTHDFEAAKIVLLATGAFAVAGIVFGLVRSLRKVDRAA
jgi:hypothetical protein